MPSFTLDFSTVPSSQPVPAGQYPVVVMTVSYVTTTGAPKLSWSLEISEGEFQGRKLTLNTSLHPNSLWFLRQLLEKLEVYQDSLTIEYDDQGSVTQPELVGIPAIADVTNDEYQGRTRALVSDLLPIRRGPIAVPGGPAKSTPPGRPSTPVFK